MKPVVLSGIVTRFKGDGRKLGYPTANLVIKTDLKDGVYFGYADLAQYTHQPAIVFIGTPTTMGETIRRVEAYLLDIPDQDYYDYNLRLDLHYYHRPNQDFKLINDLILAIKADEAAARQWFKQSASYG